MVTTPLRIRWLGRVGYDEAWDLQRQLFAGHSDHLLLLEHPPVYTLGVRADQANMLVDPAEVGAELRRVNRGGDITFHGPGQLVGYPVLTVPGKRGGGMADTVAYVASIERVLIETLADLGLEASRVPGAPGVWLDAGTNDERKVAAVGVRLSRGRSMHGFALNVDVDLDWFRHIVPCGLSDKTVTSLRREGVDASMSDVVDLVAGHATRWLGSGGEVDRTDVVWRHSPTDLAPFSRGEGPGDMVKPDRSGTAVSLPAPTRLHRRLGEAGVAGGLDVSARKPEWMLSLIHI